MYRLTPKVFFCYTTRDNYINLQLLIKLKRTMALLGLFNTYIDLLDNNNLINAQEYVIKNLKSSNILCIIKTPKTFESPWVKKEIYYANKLNIPIINIDLELIIALINVTNKDELLFNPVIIKLIQTILHNKS